MSRMRGPLMSLLGILLLLAWHFSVIRFFCIQPVNTSAYPHVRVHPLSQSLLIGGLLLAVLGSAVTIFDLLTRLRA